MNSAIAIKHQDVYGKDQFYIKVCKGEKFVMVNIGQTTYNKIIELDNQEPELPFNDANIVIDEKANNKGGTKQK